MPDLHWEISTILSTKELTKFIKENRGSLTKYDWLHITKNPHMTRQLIEDYSEDINWQYYCTFNGDLSVDFLERNIGFIDWYSVSLFQQLTLDFIKKYEDKLSFDKLVINDFITSDLKLFKEVSKMYQERLENPEYLKIWNENKENSIFRSPKRIITASPVPAKTKKVSSKKKNYTDEELTKMSKSEMKKILENLKVRVYYHDTLDILKNKIKENQGGVKNGSSK